MADAAAHPNWRSTKCQLEWNLGSICALTEEALYSISNPNATIDTTAPKRIQSVLSRWDISAFRLQPSDDLFEDFVAVFEAAELVEAGAGRGQQNRVAGAGAFESVRHGCIEIGRAHV